MENRLELTERILHAMAALVPIPEEQLRENWHMLLRAKGFDWERALIDLLVSGFYGGRQ